MALKELEVRHAAKRAKDYKLADGEGLYLLVRANGSKLWRFKYRFGGKEKLLSFGAYPVTSLADARLRRAAAKVALGQGGDPGAKEKGPSVTTFEQAARAWHANRLASLDAGHASRLLTRLENDAFPLLGSLDLRCVTSTDVLAMVRKVEARGSLDVSRRLKQHVSQIYAFAIPQGWADTDPAQHLSGLLKPKPRTRHMARIRLDELPQLVRAIDNYDGDETPNRISSQARESCFVQHRSFPAYLTISRNFNPGQRHQECRMVRFFENQGKLVGRDTIAAMRMDYARVAILSDLSENLAYMLGRHQTRFVLDDARTRGAAPRSDVV